VEALLHLLSSSASQDFAQWLVIVMLILWVLRVLTEIALRIDMHRLARRALRRRKDAPAVIRALARLADAVLGKGERKKPKE
jgi:uncharacterized membrane protein YfcA